MRLLGGPGLDDDVLVVPAFAVVREAVFRGPRLQQELETLVETLLRFLHRDAELVELGFAIAAPEPEIDPAAREQGAQALPIALDIRSQASIGNAFTEAAETLGPLDVLVNNAGVTLRCDAIDVSPEEWDGVLDVNLKGTFFMCQQMARHLVARKSPGRIINLASTHGVVALAKRSTYGISKGAIIHMTRVLAYEWAKLGICVNAVAPGTIETPTLSFGFLAFAPTP
jgi:NAD(P)-dependent dehydrogenase (short-subunit alcohol dehydrogenase family)